MTQLKTEDELLDKLHAVQEAAQQRTRDAAQAQQDRASAFEHVRPFSTVYDPLIDVLANPGDRFMLGLTPIDVLTRGFGKKELILGTGFSHAGKTQLVNTAIVNNPERRILFFSMDDPAEMIGLKLTCMVEGIDAETLERQVHSGDEEAKAKLRTAFTHTFRNLIVVDESLGLGGMTQAVNEATAYWNAPPELVVLDYLQSLKGNGRQDNDDDGGVRAKVAGLKRWVKDKPFPTMVLHQNTRSKGGPGMDITLVSAAFGGEQEATMLLGVRRKRDDTSLDQWERDKHVNTITLQLPKNKRPPCKVTPAGGIDFYIDPQTGLIRQLRDGDLKLPSVAKPVSTVSDALGTYTEAEKLRNGG